MKLNTPKTSYSDGFVAGTLTKAAGKYSDYELLRRVTLANLLFEDTFYQSANTITQQMQDLIPKVDPEKVLELAVECRNEQKLRHTPLFLLAELSKYTTEGLAGAIREMNFRPDMVSDLLILNSKLKGTKRIGRNLPQSFRKGLKYHLENYSEYQLGKYKRNNSEVSLVDAVNILHPKSTPALTKLMEGNLSAPNTWEVALSQGKDKKETFTRMIEEGSLGSMAILRNLRNMKEAGLSRKLIKKAIGQVKSSWLLPLDFLKAVRIMPEYLTDIDDAMQRCFAEDQISGTTIIAIDVSGSMGNLTSGYSSFSRLDLALANAALATYLFEDPIIVFTAGDDYRGQGKHMIAPGRKGLSLFDFNYYSTVGGGGIFTAQLCEWLKTQNLDADRLVVISDSQDIDVATGKKVKPDTSPYKTSYIIDISTHTHGIKTGVWTAEINGWSDKLFRYIKALENENLQVGNILHGQ